MGVDGVAGPGTAAGVMAYQKANGLSQTGTLDKELLYQNAAQSVTPAESSRSISLSLWEKVGLRAYLV
jgi:peptidoglycan hydrolase-like protein with peptidoglycan-binding domain